MPVTDLLWPIFVTFCASMVPGLELRAGIPVGVALGLSAPLATAVGIFGNVLQIFAAMWLVDWAYRRAARFPRVKRWLDKTEAQVQRHRPLIRRFGWLGLAIFVVLPLPGTGAWGGVVLARLLQVSAATVWMGLTIGIALSGIIIGSGVHGVVSLSRFLNW